MGTLVVGLVVLAIVVAAARSIWKDKKNGKSCGSCGGRMRRMLQVQDEN